MGKYLTIFSLGLSHIFTWKLNFFLWRVRVVLQFLLVYFLWSTVFVQQTNVFGYERAQILTYVLGVAFLRSLILSSRNQDVAGEIRDGELTNLLLRPISYFGWWWAKDLVDKVVNTLFAIVELTLLYFLLRPEFVFQTNVYFLSLAFLTAILALILYFYFSFFISLFAFWIAEVWGIRFLTFVILEFLSGTLFPLDILPQPFFRFLSFTPFPYLLFFPIKIYLGQLQFWQIGMGLSVLSVWIIVSYVATQALWSRGLRSYGGEGR